MLLYISDFDLTGSGYMQISIALCKALAEKGNKVMALGLGYKGDEHNWPFSIIPVPSAEGFMLIAGMLQNLEALSRGAQTERIDAIIVALDIPLQERMQAILAEVFKNSKTQRWPYIGIFPVESGPLCQTWANILSGMDERLVISQYGLQMMQDAKVPGRFLPVGLDTASWRPPVPEERAALRKALGFTDDQLVVLTVADNQERKNLWAASEAIKRVPGAQWVLVTRLTSSVGWKMNDLAWSLGIQERVMTFERGLPFDKLWTLYAIADAFMLTSKAEGFGMPMIEAMACGVPVVATDCTAIPEQIWDDYPANTVPRGFPILVEYRNLDPWGNSMRSWASAEDAAGRLLQINSWRKSGSDNRADLDAIINRGLAYARSRTWERATQVVSDALDAVKRPEPVLPGVVSVPVPEINPLTVPTPVPITGVKRL